MPDQEIAGLSDAEFAKLQREAQRRGVPIETLMEQALMHGLDARAKRTRRSADVRSIKRP